MSEVKGFIGRVLSAKKAAILKTWQDAVVAAYPVETATFLRKVKDPFANPVGNAITRETERIFDALVQGSPPEDVVPHLEEIIRVRSVQDFSPAEAVAFVFLLKDALRKELDAEIQAGQHIAELLAFESRIDSLALLAFGLYMHCRERIYELRADEVKRQTATLLDRARRREARATGKTETRHQPTT